MMVIIRQIEWQFFNAIERPELIRYSSRSSKSLLHFAVFDITSALMLVDVGNINRKRNCILHERTVEGNASSE